MNPAGSTSSSVLALRDVSKNFSTRRGELNAVTDIRFDVREGEFVCVVGPSGCGKSTVLNLIAGLDRPDGGSILLDGRPVDGPGPDRVVVFQEGALFPWMTVSENVGYGLKVQKVPAEELDQRVEKVLRLVHLDRFASSYIHELSGGMRQRVAIARGLVLQPRILLMDEPFNALDTQTRDLLIEELRAIHSEIRNTVLFVTHNVREAVYLADRVILISFRPGSVRNIFKIALPRPRDPDNPELEAIVRGIVGELHEEVEKAVAKEFGP
ncbi:MAG: nitrate/sulfonate/bicarbonate ABC transporter ATP-binding protein [Elusimicrobia bacterium RIFCSPLOWO2_01_FULL_64_13]|nr:MAG: nitrate/sulfonate/bicarbonate ABC transporter ATP-binding protein [Elusimicrobia bacterium RIFCSPHIGHO2_01_FULL_64_10]OGR94257.1 MAG: nitrate/sulfonate/bicarbonate ABC transporter ATP-binding protein [Elusimicrobia bacterium RIFCSPLOWO2_01_FULL_64_13]